MPWSGSRQTAVAHSACDWTIGQSRRGSRSLRRDVQQDRVQHGAEDVVLALVERSVADPDRPGTRVPGQVVPGGLGQVASTVDPVHDLQRTVGVRLQVGDELDELVGLPVQVQVVQGLQGEGGVPHPGVAVVPVAFAARRLRQRCGERGDGGPGRHVGEALDHQRRALERVTPAVVRHPGPSQPGSPEPGRGIEATGGLGDVLRCGQRFGPTTARSSTPPRPRERAGPGPGCPPRRG